MMTNTNTAALATATDAEIRALADLAIGRLLRMGQRAARPGDSAELDRIKAIVLEASRRAS